MDNLTYYSELCKFLNGLSGAPIIMYREETPVLQYSNVILPKGINLHQQHFNVLRQSTESVTYTIEDNKFLYGAVKVKDATIAFMIGPICLTAISESVMKRYLFNHNVPEIHASIVSEYIFYAPVIPFNYAIQMLLFFNLVINRETVPPTALLLRDTDKNASTLEQAFGEMFRHNEQLQYDEVEKHTSLQFENRMLFYIQNGLPKKLIELFENESVGRTGKLSSDSLRQEKNNGICSITLSTRAAIAGGLNSEIAFQFSDITIQQIENCRTINEINMITYKTTLELCERVAALQKNASSNPMIDRIIKYIIEHICEKITVDELAKLVHTNRSFLSGKFKSEMGISLNEYINKQKITEAKRLLLHTDRSLPAIASYLSFSSQSHFQNTFKKITGITPSNYRKNKSH